MKPYLSALQPNDSKDCADSQLTEPFRSGDVPQGGCGAASGGNLPHAVTKPGGRAYGTYPWKRHDIASRLTDESPFEARQLMQLCRSQDVAVGTAALEASAISLAVVRDVYALASAVRLSPPEFSLLADRAIAKLIVALREAAGSPNDERWRTAYEALARFLDCYGRCASGEGHPESFDRLSNFLSENADLAPIAATHPVYHALAHAYGR